MASDVSQRATALRDYLSIRGLDDGEIERTLERIRADATAIERERCALVADTLDMGEPWSTADSRSRFHARSAIAAAIRKGSTT